MPIEARVRREFAEAVMAALGGISPNQASYKTGVSDEYIRKMSNGRVPSVDVIRRFAQGMGVDVQSMLVAAGYEQPPAEDRAAAALSEMDDHMKGIELSLRCTDIPERGKQQIMDFVKEMQEKYSKEQP